MTGKGNFPIKWVISKTKIEKIREILPETDQLVFKKIKIIALDKKIPIWIYSSVSIPRITGHGFLVRHTYPAF
jgi:hypothetical protein